MLRESVSVKSLLKLNVFTLSCADILEKNKMVAFGLNTVEVLFTPSVNYLGIVKRSDKELD